jgi:hypothetical protein
VTRERPAQHPSFADRELADSGTQWVVPRVALWVGQAHGAIGHRDDRRWSRCGLEPEVD